MKLQTLIIPVFVATALASGCTNTASQSVRIFDRQNGTISSIDTGQRTDSNDSAVAGTVIGGVVGGVVGHQLGSGKTNDAATVAGVVGARQSGAMIAA